MEDNSVLLEDTLEDTNPPRRSLSQPSLGNQPTTAPARGAPGGVKHIPILQTWHENEELKGKMYTLKVEVQMHKRNYLEAKETCHKSVQEVLDEYVELKIAQEDMQEKAQQFLEMENELRTIREQLDFQNEELKEFEIQKQIMEQRIRELEQPDNTMCSLKGTLDDIMKKNDPDYTLTSYEERKISELEEKLLREQQKVQELEEHCKVLREEIDDQSARLAEHHRAQELGGATFMLGNVRESATGEQLQYIDELEQKLKEANSESEKARLALVEYMNRCSKLENDLKKNSTFDNSSLLIGKSSEELKAQIEKVNNELNSLRSENRELRVRCDRLNGGDGNCRNVSESLGESRLMAGISPAVVLTSNEPIRAHNQEQESQLNESAAIRTFQDAAFDSEWKEFQADQNRLDLMGNQTVESSFSMPPPGADATQSFLSQKGGKMMNFNNDNSFSTKSIHAPLLQDVQQLLESSQILLDVSGQPENLEKMQENMKLVREALARLFERLKSSAALFEEILEKMGSHSPLADRIKQMKLAFETSLCDHADVSVLLEAAEKDLTNLSLNASNLERSMTSFAPDCSKSFVNSPVFKLPSASRVEEVEKLQKEISELKNELEHSRALRSPLYEARLSDVQIKAAQNFEELEVCQATLKKVETEKAQVQKELAELDSAHRSTVLELNLVQEELEKLQMEHEKEKVKMNSGNDEKSQKMMVEMEEKMEQSRQIHERIIENLKEELRKSLNEENALSDKVEELKLQINNLNLRIHESESKAMHQDEERAQLIQQLFSMEDELAKLKKFEIEATNYSKKLAEKKEDLASGKQREEMEHECFSGLERIQKEIGELTKKTPKKHILMGDSSSIRAACDEICRRLSQERIRQHEDAEALRAVNDKIEQQMMHNEHKENVVPMSSSAAPQSDKAKYQCPTRQLLRESTVAVDSIVQRLKKTCMTSGMSQELKQSVVELLTDARALREFLHQKLLLFKGIDVTNWRNETVEQLLERLEQCLQNNLMLEEENRKMKKEVKRVKVEVANLGTDVQERIKREIGGIAKDMGAVKALQKKK